MKPLFQKGLPGVIRMFVQGDLLKIVTEVGEFPQMAGKDISPRVDDRIELWVRISAVAITWDRTEWVVEDDLHRCVSNATVRRCSVALACLTFAWMAGKCVSWSSMIRCLFSASLRSRSSLAQSIVPPGNRYPLSIGAFTGSSVSATW